jgi:hypothetical protein
MAVWRDAMAKAKNVDMMDNADALTTCPQQQTESLAIDRDQERSDSNYKPIQAVPLRGSISEIRRTSRAD